MAEEQTQDDEVEKGPKRPIGMIIGSLVTALLAGAASFGGAAYGSARTAAPPPAEAPVEDNSPGPTVRLAPFVLSIADQSGEAHAMKVSIAVELSKDAKEDELKPFIPRMRDATIALLRQLSFDDARSAETQDKLRATILDKVHELGVAQATQIWFTDLVMQ